MKSVLIAIQPKWCKLISEGKKTVEVRKTKPKLDVPFKCYIYMTKDKPTFEQGAFSDEISNGKVIGEFVCDRIQEITYTQIYNFGRYKDVCEAETRLDFYALDDYLKQKNGYGWNISDLVIYDKPKELGEFCTWKKCNSCRETGYESTACIYDEDCKVPVPIKRPPQSWCYVEEVSQ